MEMCRPATLLNTAGQGRSGTTNHDETSEGVEGVEDREGSGEGADEQVERERLMVGRWWRSG
jgi:hypothetical protein